MPVGKNKIKEWKFFLRLLVSLSLITFFIIKLDLKKVSSLLLSTQKHYIMLAVLLITLDRVMICCRQWIILRRRKSDINFIGLIRIYWIGDFAGFFLPGLIGGDIVKVYGLSKKINSIHDAAAFVFVERVLGVLSICCVAFAGLTFRMGETIERTIMWYIVIIFSIIIVFISVFLSSNFEKIIDKSAVYKNIITKNIIICYRSLRWVVSNKGLIFYVFCICIAVQLGRVVVSYIIAVSLGLNIHFFEFMIFVPIIFIAVMLPISIGGFGVQEAGYIYFFGLMGVRPVEAFSISLLSNILTIFVALPGGLLYAKGGVVKTEGNCVR